MVKLAIEEDAEVIGISSLATDHLLVPRLMTALRDAGVSDVQVIVGGIVPARDEKLLLDAGVARVFHPGTSLEDIAAEIRTLSTRARCEKRKCHEQARRGAIRIGIGAGRTPLAGCVRRERGNH